MADEPQVIRGIDWHSTFPFTLIFRSFRIAIHPSKLFLALIGLFLVYSGGRALDSLWTYWPEHRALTKELSIFEASREADNPNEAFIQARAMQRDAIEARHKAMLADPRIGKPNGSLKDIEWRIRKDLDDQYADINKRFDQQIASAPDAAAKARLESQRNRALHAAYDEASSDMNAAHEYEGKGLFLTFFNYEVGQLNAVVRAVQNGELFGTTGMTVPLRRFFMWGPLWAIGRHTVFFTIFGLYFLTIWSIFGGAIARIAAVHVARDEKLSIRQALAFALNKFLSFISAPIIPMLIVLIVGLVVGVGGILANLPGLGPPIVGALFFLALLAGFIMTLILLGLVGGFNLMYPTIAVEGSDSFDAISRSFSYLYARPWRLAFYTLVAVIYGSICYVFARFFTYMMLWLAHAFAGMFIWSHAQNGTPLFNAMWPEPYANGRLVYDIDYLALTSMQCLGATLLAFWVYLTISMLGAFAISFYFSSNTIIYYLMRNEVDATELDDVYLEQSDEEFTDMVTPPSESSPSTTTTVTTVTAETTASDEPSPPKTETPPREAEPPAE